MKHIVSIHSDAGAAAIAEVAEQRLRQSPYFYLKSLRCQFEAGVLTLCGRVPYRPLKLVAESIVARVEGVQRVVNRLEVVDPALGTNGVPAARNAG